MGSSRSHDLCSVLSAPLYPITAFPTPSAGKPKQLTSQSAHLIPGTLPPPDPIVGVGSASRFPANTGQLSSSCGPSHSSHRTSPSPSSPLRGGEGYSSAVCIDPVLLLPVVESGDGLPLALEPDTDAWDAASEDDRVGVRRGAVPPVPLVLAPWLASIWGWRGRGGALDECETRRSRSSSWIRVSRSS